MVESRVLIVKVRRKGETKTVLQTLTQEGANHGTWGDPPDLLEVLLGDFWDHFDQDILMGYFNGILMWGDLLL